MAGVPKPREILHADYVMYGKVKTFRSFTVYSDYLTVEVRWWSRYERVSGVDGNVPTTEGSPLRSGVCCCHGQVGLHMQRGRLTSSRESAEIWSLKFLSRLRPGAPYPWIFKLPSRKSRAAATVEEAGASVEPRVSGPNHRLIYIVVLGSTGGPGCRERQKPGGRKVSPSVHHSWKPGLAR
jgi:hypothetical protein